MTTDSFTEGFRFMFNFFKLWLSGSVIFFIFFYVLLEDVRTAQVLAPFFALAGALFKAIKSIRTG